VDPKRMMSAFNAHYVGLWHFYRNASSARSLPEPPGNKYNAAATQAARPPQS
jgi:hypothetical protein